MSDTRARVETNFTMQGVSVWIRTRRGDYAETPRWDRAVRVTGPVDEFAPAPAASLTLRDDEARALLDALLDHYGMVKADLRLRADYDAERARVDKLVDHLIAVDTP